MYSLGTSFPARYDAIQTGKNTANEIEKIFPVNPMPNQTITRGTIATGGRGRRAWNTGVITALAVGDLADTSPTQVPNKPPRSHPKIARDQLTTISWTSSPDANQSLNAINTSVGGGNSLGSTIEYRAANSQSKSIPKIDVIDRADDFANSKSLARLDCSNEPTLRSILLEQGQLPAEDRCTKRRENSALVPQQCQLRCTIPLELW